MAIVLAVLGWDLGSRAITSSGFELQIFFSRLFFWVFIGFVGLLTWSSLKALHSWTWRLGLVAAVTVGAILAVMGTAGEFRQDWEISVTKQVDDKVTWMVKEWRWFFRDVTEKLLWVLVPLEGRLLQIPWWLLTGVMALLAWRVSGYRVALISTAGLLFLVVLGLWDGAMQTLAVVGSAAFIAIALAVPLGIAMSKNDLVESFMRPVLDTMQTMPSFVYLIPAIYFLGLGKVPAVMATLVYAMPPAIRLTNLGIRLVSPELKEAARAFGTTGWQMLVKVELPLARPTIMAGVNQAIMMALAMVVLATFVGAKGLGADVVSGVAELKFGKGLMGGIGIVILAVIIDRISQGFAKGAHSQASI